MNVTNFKNLHSDALGLGEKAGMISETIAKMFTNKVDRQSYLDWITSTAKDTTGGEIVQKKFAKENMSKPVVAYIAGLTAPKGRVMGHAGAIVSAYGESAVEKVELLEESGVIISKNPSVMGDTVKQVLNGKKN